MTHAQLMELATVLQRALGHGQFVELRERHSPERTRHEVQPTSNRPIAVSPELLEDCLEAVRDYARAIELLTDPRNVARL